MKWIFLVLCYSSLAYTLECPNDSYEVDFNSSTEGLNYKFCQYSKDGKYIKNGPEVITRSYDGKLVSEKFYKDGVELTTQKSIRENSKCGKEKELFNSIYSDLRRTVLTLLGFDFSGDKIFFSIQEKGCPHDPMKRLAFIKQNKGYDWKLQQVKNCYFDGMMPFYFDKELTANLKFESIQNFDRLLLKYKITKTKKSENELSLFFDLRESSLFGTGNQIDFVGKVFVDVNLSEVMSSNGKRGVSTQLANLSTTKINENQCVVEKDFLKD